MADEAEAPHKMEQQGFPEFKSRWVPCSCAKNKNSERMYFYYVLQCLVGIFQGGVRAPWKTNVVDNYSK